jgi:predicted Zn-dependent peptidase
MRDVASVALGVYVSGGSADEGPGARGSTHFLEHLLFRRTRRRSGAAIARMTDRLGGDCDAYTTKETVAFHARTTAERAGEALDLLLDLTETPAFTAADVETERSVILEEMAEAKDIPEDHLHDAFVRRLWPSHPLGAPVFGTEESVKELSRADLATRFHELFRPARTLVVAAGSFDQERIVARLETARDRARRRTPKLPAPPLRQGRPRPHRCLLDVPRPDLVQTHVLIGAPTIGWGDPRRMAASLAATILGGGVSSRLWRDVREKRGLAYHVGAGLTLHRAAGLALVEAATHPKNLTTLVRAAGRILHRLLEDGVTKAELSRAKHQVRAEIALSLESTAARREAAARGWLVKGRPVPPEEVLAEVDAATADDVAEAARLMFGRLGPIGLGVSGPPVPGVRVEDLLNELAA